MASQFISQTQLISQTISRFPRIDADRIKIEPLEKGGSDRKFYRIQMGVERSLILAKYGDQRDENRHYVAIARFLHEVGVRVPEVYFHDEAEGLIWMEDLGERDLWSYREEAWPTRRALYQSTLDQVLVLHTSAHLAYETASSAPKLQIEFNAELYRWEQNYFMENCLGRFFGLSGSDLDERCCRARLDEIAEQLAKLPRCFVHRDFQSQNIVIKDGAAALIDFQGMRPGLVQYDLASLLYDPYVPLTSEERAELLEYYLAQWRDLGGDVPENFAEVYDLCAMQRLMQALGAYGFLGLVKDRPDFLQHIPVALPSLHEVLGRIPGLEELRALVGELANSLKS
ncbi:aminoglycoside phosphotransferase family protein [Verrucomicrobiota bacterium sgz303538]